MPEGKARHAGGRWYPIRFRRQYLSYIPTGEGFLYLAAIEDLATRQIVGWSMADHLCGPGCASAPWSWPCSAAGRPRG